MTATIVGFVGARRRAFRLELRRINRDFHDKIAKARKWPLEWYTPDFADVDASNIDIAIRARAENLFDATTFLCRKRLADCLAAARRYGADPAPFDKALKRWAA